MIEQPLVRAAPESDWDQVRIIQTKRKAELPSSLSTPTLCPIPSFADVCLCRVRIPRQLIALIRSNAHGLLWTLCTDYAHLQIQMITPKSTQTGKKIAELKTPPGRCWSGLSGSSVKSASIFFLQALSKKKPPMVLFSSGDRASGKMNSGKHAPSPPRPPPPRTTSNYLTWLTFCGDVFNKALSAAPARRSVVSDALVKGGTTSRDAALLSVYFRASQQVENVLPTRRADCTVLAYLLHFCPCNG